MTDRARAVKETVTNALLEKRNVVGVSVGYKRVGSDATANRSITVLVTKKIPSYQLSQEDLVPQAIAGWTTDVVEVGRIQAPPPPYPIGPMTLYTEKHRPAVPGASIGHYQITAGTFGCVAYDPEGTPFILSNNHVLANSNDAKLGDAILQPGPYDGGKPADAIASLSDFVPIDLTEVGATCAASNLLLKFLNWLAGLVRSRHQFFACRASAGSNLVDAATAVPTTPSIISPEILHLGTPKGIHEGALNMNVEKVGRTTGHTFGDISQTDATVIVNYGSGRTARFEDQLIVTAKSGQFSAGGDSGSLVLDEDGYAVGLLFAGSQQVTIINRIQNVLDQLDVTL